MKILLVNPPFYRLVDSHYNGMSLGIAYLSSILNKNGHSAQIYNADYKEGDDYRDQVEIARATKKYKSLLGDEDNPFWSEIVQNIISTGSDIVGFTCFTANIHAIGILARKLKSRDSNLKIVVGGVHPTLVPEYMLKNRAIDAVVRGDGEQALLDIANGVPPENIPGVSFVRDSAFFHSGSQAVIEKLDSLPFPDRENYLVKPQKSDLGYIVTSRGCPYQCTYCASPKLCGRKVRFRSPQNVYAEMQSMYSGMGINKINFQDDIFTYNRGMVEYICDSIIRDKMHIEWICDTRIDRIDRELLLKMKKAGCVRLKVGAESGDDEILKKVKKGISTSDVERGARLIKEAGLKLTVYLMIGYPGQTDSSVQKTIDFAHRIDADYYSLSILAPYYGTKVYEEMQETGQLQNEGWEYFFHQNLELLEHSRISPKMVEGFLSLNKRGKTGRL